MHGRYSWLSHGLALALGVAALVVAHGVLLKDLSARLTLPAMGIAAVVVLAVILHLGAIGAVLTRLRRHFHPKDE
jgi:membrane protein YdbS with pleckstrin-like domain